MSDDGYDGGYGGGYAQIGRSYPLHVLIPSQLRRGCYIRSCNVSLARAAYTDPLPLQDEGMDVTMEQQDEEILEVKLCKLAVESCKAVGLCRGHDD